MAKGMMAVTSSAIRPMAPANVIPPTQNTAPVLEFRCLYTSDLRRKQKRWQDGGVKYHTFNKRVMVYDDRGNFVGDTHWREDYSFEEGEELELERRGVIIQVSECIGKRDQDLTELLDKRLRDREGKVLPKVTASPSAQVSRLADRTHVYNSPSEAPSQQMSAKRKRPIISPKNKNGYAQNLTGAILSLSGSPLSTTPLRYNPLWPRNSKQPTKGVDLSEQHETQLVSLKRRPELKGSLVQGNVQEDEFADIHAYEKKPVRDREVWRISHANSRPVVSAEKILPLPQHSIGQPITSDQDWGEKPVNPLRIKARSRRKLMLVARPEPQQQLLTEPTISRKDTVTDPPTVRFEMHRSQSQTKKQLDAFHERQIKRTSSCMNIHQPFVTQELPSSSPGDRGIDHNTNDAVLSGKSHAPVSQTNTTRSKTRLPAKGKSSSRTMKRPRHFITGEDSARTSSASHISDFPSSVRPRTEHDLMQPESQALISGDKNNDSDSKKRHSHGSSRPSMMLNTPGFRQENAAHRGDATNKALEAVLQPARQLSKSSDPIQMSKASRPNEVLRRDLGPWSREAFDLFEWKPKVLMRAEN